MKLQAAKIIKVETGRTNKLMMFTSSNFWGMKFWEAKETIEGTFNQSRKVFTANDGRTFKISADFTAAENKTAAMAAR